MSGDAVAEIKARLDIVEVVGSYVALHRAGREHKGLCPFHAEKTPSFAVSQEKQAWYCFGCSDGGDVISFVEKIERTDFRQTLELLAERAGVELEKGSGPADRGAGKRRRRALELNGRAARYYQHALWELPAGEPGRAMLEERGVQVPLARQFGVGFAPAGGLRGDALIRYLTHRGEAAVGEVVDAGLAHPARGGGGRDRFRHRLVFPICDERGQVVAFGGRALGDARPKYLNSPETAIYHKSTALFGLDQAREALKRSRVAVVVEGYFDVLAAHGAGVANVVASSGTALAREQVRVLARHADSVVLCFDADDAGQLAASRAVDQCAAEGLPARIALMPPGVKDPDELVRSQPGRFPSVIAAAPPEWQVLLERAIGGPGAAVEERRVAAERAVAVLARIPEAATRDLYIQEAARRLGLSADALVADVARLLAGESRRPVRFSAPSPAGERAGAPAEEGDGDGFAAPDPGHPVPAWEEYVGTYVVQRPALARVLVEGLGLDVGELANPQVRHLVGVALAVPPGLGFPLHALGPADKRLAARLLLREVPEFGGDAPAQALERAMADCVARVGVEAVRAEMAREQEQLRAATAAGDQPEQADHAARLSHLAAKEARLRRRLA